MRVYRYLIVAAAILCIGLVLHATGALHVESGTWIAGPSMNTARTGAASVLMPDGRVLVTGGSGADGNALATAEFVKADGSISDAPQMGSARTGHSAVWLPTGYVLVAGGTTSGGGTTNSAELFDPLSNQWTTLSSTMVEARTDFTATVLRFGNVVIAGGNHAGVPVSSVELFDVSSETFSSIGALSSARKDAAAAAISDFNVIVAGGSDVNGATLASTEIIDTENGTITAGPAMNSPRQSASATVLLDGRVLVAGGSYPEGADANGGVAELASTDIYDLLAGTMAAGPSLSAARAGHQAFLLPNNNGVLLVGGVTAGQELASADLYSAGSFTAQASMSAARKQRTGSALQNPAFGAGTDGVLLIAGGSNLATSEFYGFATVKTDKDDYAPGTPVIITGSGWVPGETVSLSLLESPALDTHSLSSVVADSNGNIYSNEFAPDAQDLGIRFYLTAAGSKGVAQNTFTDGNATSVTGTVRSSAAGNPVISGALVTCSSGCTGTITATSNASGAYTFASSNKLAFPTNGPVTLQITAAAPGFNSSTITLSNVNNGDSFSNQNFILTPSTVATTTVIASSLATPKYGDSVTFTATVTPASGNVAPTGTVVVKIDGGTVAASTSPSGNKTLATFTTTALTAGSHTIDAAYTASGNFNSSTALQFAQSVGKAPSPLLPMTRRWLSEHRFRR